jgi:hypothetical protein
MSRIDWSHDGRRVLLPVLILKPEPTDVTHVEAVALLDTGANVSGIVRRIALELGLRSAGKRPLISARGEIQVERYLFRVGLAVTQDKDVPAFPYIFEETLGFELGELSPFGDGRSIDAVLGMDVLRQCDFEMRRDSTCTLRFG